MIARSVLFLIASGQAFLLGAGCLVVAAGVSRWATQQRALRIARNLLVGLGGVLVAASATPLPGLVALGLGGLSVIWLVIEASGARWSGWLRGLVAVAWLGAGVVEARHQVIPTVARLGRPVFSVVGDSLTAGDGDARIITWPERLAQAHAIDVRDHSAAGATVQTAARQAAAIGADERLVLLEIGGNDLLGGTTPEAFEVGLARLLALVGRPGRSVVMLELPLVPGWHRFGLIQRRLCARAGVILIPKRVLAALLLADGATVDSIHLSNAGQDRLARTIWALIQPAYAD